MVQGMMHVGISEDENGSERQVRNYLLDHNESLIPLTTQKWLHCNFRGTICKPTTLQKRFIYTR